MMATVAGIPMGRVTQLASAMAKIDATLTAFEVRVVDGDYVQALFDLRAQLITECDNPEINPAAAVRYCLLATAIQRLRASEHKCHGLIQQNRQLQQELADTEAKLSRQVQRLETQYREQIRELEAAPRALTGKLEKLEALYRENLHSLRRAQTRVDKLEGENSQLASAVDDLTHRLNMEYQLLRRHGVNL